MNETFFDDGVPPRPVSATITATSADILSILSEHKDQNAEDNQTLSATLTTSFSAFQHTLDHNMQLLLTGINNLCDHIASQPSSSKASEIPHIWAPVDDSGEDMTSDEDQSNIIASFDVSSHSSTGSDASSKVPFISPSHHQSSGSHDQSHRSLPSDSGTLDFFLGSQPWFLQLVVCSSLSSFHIYQTNTYQS